MLVKYPFRSASEADAFLAAATDRPDLVITTIESDAEGRVIVVVEEPDPCDGDDL